MGKRHRPVSVPSRTSYLRSQHLRRTGQTHLPEDAVLSSKMDPLAPYWHRPVVEKVSAATRFVAAVACELECVGSTLLRWHCGKCGYNATHDAAPGCQKENMKDKQKESPKGTFGGRCNRSACLKPGATWWHLSNRAYYCARCALMLNEDPFNKRDAETLYGGPLCVEHQAEGVSK